MTEGSAASVGVWIPASAGMTDWSAEGAFPFTATVGAVREPPLRKAGAENSVHPGSGMRGHSMRSAPALASAVGGIVEHGKRVVEEVFHAHAETVEVALRGR